MTTTNLHLAREAEERSPEEMEQLHQADSLVASYGLTIDELEWTLYALRRLYRGSSSNPSDSVARFLDDLARAVDDAAIDARHPTGTLS